MEDNFNPYKTSNSLYGSFWKGDSQRKFPKDLYENKYSKEHQGHVATFKGKMSPVISSNNETIDLFKSTPIPQKGLAKSFTGLTNFCKNCFVNSTIQILSHSLPFVAKFLKEAGSLIAKNIHPCPISRAYYDLLMRLEKAQSYTSISPKDLFDVFISKHPQYLSYPEQDTQEFCRDFLQDINYEMSKNWGVKTDVTPLPLGERKNESYIKFLDECNKHEVSFVSNLFFGNLVYELQCECGQKYYNYSKFCDLPIYLNDSKSLSFELNSLIDSTFKRVDKVMNEETCAKCGQKRYLKHSFKVAQLPDILIFSLQRFDFVGKTKNDGNVKFADVIDLGNIVDPELNSN